MDSPVRKDLCADTLISTVYQYFQKIPVPETLPSTSFTDLLMSGLAIFGLKFPSLLQYEQCRKTLDQNLLNLYHIKSPPSDTCLRERLDELNPDFIRPVFKKIFAQLQRGKCFEEFEFLDGYYLLALDDTGEFSSSAISCPQCCTKEHKDGSITYYHQMLGACIVHPEQSNVIPLCPEIIQNAEGSVKSDYERDAKRFIENFKKEHPHLKVMILGDGIASNMPCIRLLESHKMKYLLSVNPDDHQSLFDAVDVSENTKYHEFRDSTGFFHQFHYLNDVALNKSNPDIRVNFLEYKQTDPKGKDLRFSWVTNILITSENAFTLMQGGRSGWKMENETFNTLKNLGYNLEHNHGHGRKYLSTNLCLLMLLAFLIDQAQEISCSLFQTVKKQAGSFQVLWEDTQTLFKRAELSSWKSLYKLLSADTRMQAKTS